MKGAQLANRTLFVASVIVTGAIAGAFVWLLLFAMNLGITFIWDRLPAHFGPYFPLVACLVGGLVIGLFAKKFGSYPEDLNQVMAKVKRDGRYDYDKLGVMSASALLPLFFGGSVGPEAGLTGAVAGICTWVGDRMKRFGSDFQQLTSVGTMAALSAIFTAPLFGFAAPLYDDGDEAKGAQAAIALPKSSKIVVYLCAIAGALAAFLGLGALFGGGLSLPTSTWERPSFCGSCRSRWWARQAVGCSVRSTACSSACPNAWESVPWQRRSSPGSCWRSWASPCRSRCSPARRRPSSWERSGAP